jgi:hypothetical protein
MVIEISKSTSYRSGNEATKAPSSSVTRQNRTGHLTVMLAWGLVALALGWGLYESVQLLTGAIPKF